MIEVGSTVGNYKVVQKIGSGAMGAVFLATHPVIGKRVALKVIHPELANNEEMVGRFFNEARAVTQIGHDHIVDVQDFGQTPDGDSFIVMELLEGVGLGDQVKREGAFSIPRATHIAIQMADGLAAAHARGIIHRDLKPDNVMLVHRGGDSDFVKILDFGLAKLQGPGAMQNKTKTGSLLGTPHFMPPEQCEGKKTVDQRSDVYALGCILFQMVTGRVPFPGEGFGEVLVKHLREPPPLPSRLNPAVPRHLEMIILHALAKKPEFRFQSMDDFRSALRDPERFAAKMDAEAALIHPTPSEPFPAPIGSPVAVGPPPALPVMPPSAPAQLPSDAPTVMGAAPPQVEQLLAARKAQAAAAPKPVTAFDVGTAPGKRALRRTIAQPGRRVKPKRGVGSTVSVAAVLLLFSAAGVLAYWFFIPRSRTVSVTISSTPAGAAVFDGGRLLGKTPLTLALPRGDEAVRLLLRKDGFLGAQRSIQPTADQEVVIKLLAQPVDPDAEPPRPEEPPRPAPPSVTFQPARPTPAKPTPPATPTPDPPRPPEIKPAEPKPHPHGKKKSSSPLLLTPSF